MGFPSILLLVATASLAAPPDADGDAWLAPAPDTGMVEPVPDRTGLYLGHTMVGNERTLPVLGTLRTRTDTWVLARITDLGDRLVVEQQPCDLEIKPVAGVRVSMDEGTVPRLPTARFELRARDGELSAPPWRTGWDQEDLDADGDPGVTIRVRAPLCGGHLQVASQTVSTATGQWDGGELAGLLQVEVDQRILGASGACLKLAASDTVERLHGSFRYRPVPPGTTCSSVPVERWPAAE